MTTKTRGIRITSELANEIAREAEERGKTWSGTTNELLDEAIRMRRAPGIVFVDGPSGRRPVIAGSGIDVWEVVETWRQCGEDYDQVRRSFDWLTEPQVRAALAYYSFYPEDIDTRIERERRWTPERVWKELPFSAPKGKRRRPEALARSTKPVR
jgi:uncharacterized protein (DUF433 family)